MSSSIFVPLPDRERQALRDLAEREWRTTKEQAGLLIAEGLRRRGLLTDDQPPPEPDHSRDPDLAAGHGHPGEVQ